MSRHSDSIRIILGQGLATARKIVEKTGLSQPTVSRSLAAIGNEIVRIGAGSSIQYAIRDNSRGFGEVPICRVTDTGKLRELGVLIPVRPNGFVMMQTDGVTIHSDGLPWWMFDMHPQGYLGRAYASAYASILGLPSNPEAWDDSGVMRALISHGHDAVGNLLVGNLARNRFINSATPPLIGDRASEYPRLAVAAGAGELPGSSAGGEQPKFCAYTERGHVLVKFSAQDDNPVTERWRDLLMAEHLALTTLGSGSEVLDVGRQRFLEVSRFDRVGVLGRVGVISLKSLDAEFVGDATAPWPAIVARIAAGDHVVKEAVAESALLWAFGVLIGNTDMHTGNLSFVSSHGRPYRLAPAYDMLPMGFQPRSGGGIVDTLPPATLTASIDGDTWREALRLAKKFLGLLMSSGKFSPRFSVCIDTLERHIMEASGRIARIV